LQSETWHLGESPKWTLFATRVKCRPGARDLVVLLRVMGGGVVWWDGVNVRPVGGEVVVKLDQIGQVVGLPASRMVSGTVENVTAEQLPVRLGVEIIPRKGKTRTAARSVTLAPGQTQRLAVGYRFDARSLHKLRVIVTGAEPDEVYDYYERPVPGLVDAHVVEPAFRSSLMSTIPGDDVIIEGRLNATPELARQAAISARLLGTGAETDQVEMLSDEGPAGPWRIRLSAEGMLTEDYQVDVRARIGRFEHTLSLPLSRCPHSDYEVAYDATGRLYVHGKPLFPIGLHRITRSEDLAVARDAGFNFVITPSRSCSYRYMQAARDIGMLVALSSTTLEGRFWQNMTDKYGLHPALLGYYGLPLPDTQGATPELLSQVYMHSAGSYGGIAQMDTHHPVLLTLRPNATLSAFARACDIVIVEINPVPRWPLTAVSDAIEYAIQAVEGHKPVWAAIQATGLAWQPGSRLDRNSTGRPPTAAEHRAMVFLALISGADGLVHFSYALPYMSNRPEYRLQRDAPQLWESMKITNQQVAWLAPILSAGPPVPIPTPEDCPLRMAAWNYEGKQYIIAVNPTADALALSFDIGASADDTIDVLFEQRRLLATATGQVGDAFQPFEVHIYAREL
ncbi:MAG: hypothetical protein J7M38_12870, partial [Armatimonadetes bacterium]|nr:hypothetical protein [Armatimonadota bacterium]